MEHFALSKKENHLLPTTPQLIESYTEDGLIPMGDESLNYFSFGVSEWCQIAWLFIPVKEWQWVRLDVLTWDFQAWRDDSSYSGATVVGSTM